MIGGRFDISEKNKGKYWCFFKYKYKVMKLPDNYLMSAPGEVKEITYFSASHDFFKVEEKEAMSLLKRLIKTFDPKKKYF